MSKKTNQQAASLEELFNEIQQDSDQEQTEKQLPEKQLMPKIDVLNLPPRKEVHGGNNNRMIFKVGKPLGRLLLVCVLLLIIGVGSYLLWGENLEVFINNF